MADDVSSLSDDVLRDRLASYGLKNIAITKQTREIFRRKLRQLSGRPVESNTNAQENTQQTNVEPSPATPSVKSPDDPGGYYAVTSGTPEGGPMVYESRSEAVKAAKTFPGARFKRFDTPDDAKNYSLSESGNQPENESETVLSGIGRGKLMEKECNPLSSVKTKEKNRVRKLLEKGEVDQFIDLIWKNPKYLISSGESPEIYHEGTRRNILHCAVDYGNLEFCKALFNIIRSDRFWETLYPKDSLEKRNTDRQLLIDKYLNMQDGTERLKTFETPLHIASKKGEEKIVEYLMSCSAIDPSIRNFGGKTAADIACCRMSQPNNKLRDRIVQLINTPPIYYVPVIRSPDNSSSSFLGEVCTLSESLTQSDPMVVAFSEETGSHVIGQAFAGPLSPAKAEELHKKWKSPSSKEERRIVHQIRRSDPDRGLERVGRDLAHLGGVGWVEYWDFLSCYCDLSKPSGLLKLENYLKNKEKAPPPGTPTNSKQRDTGRPVQEGDDEMMEFLTPKRLFVANEDYDVDQKGTVVCEENPLSSFSEDKICPEDPVKDLVSKVIKISLEECEVAVSSSGPSETEKAGNNEISLDQCRTPEIKQSQFETPKTSQPRETTSLKSLGEVYITGDKPTKLDRDVYLALCGAEVDPASYPNVTRWKNLIDTYNEEERKNWLTPKSSTSYAYQPAPWRAETIQPLSPLLLSSPPPSTFSPTTHLRPSTLPNCLSRSPYQRRWQQATPTNLIGMRNFSPLRNN